MLAPGARRQSEGHFSYENEAFLPRGQCRLRKQSIAASDRLTCSFRGKWAHSVGASVELRLKQNSHFGAMTDLRKKKSGEYVIGCKSPTVPARRGRSPSCAKALKFCRREQPFNQSLAQQPQSCAPVPFAAKRSHF